MSDFGTHIRDRRELLRVGDPAFSLRRVAQQIGVQPSFLSKVERGLDSPPSEPKIRHLAEILGEDPDVLLALAGKVSSDLLDCIRGRPQLFAELIRSLKDAPDPVVGDVARKVREGRW